MLLWRMQIVGDGVSRLPMHINTRRECDGVDGKGCTRQVSVCMLQPRKAMLSRIG